MDFNSNCKKPNSSAQMVWKLCPIRYSRTATYSCVGSTLHNSRKDLLYRWQCEWFHPAWVIHSFANKPSSWHSPLIPVSFQQIPFLFLKLARVFLLLLLSTYGNLNNTSSPVPVAYFKCLLYMRPGSGVWLSHGMIHPFCCLVSSHRKKAA